MLAPLGQRQAQVHIEAKRSEVIQFYFDARRGSPSDAIWVKTVSLGRVSRKGVMPHRLRKTEAIKIMVTPAELAAIDDYAVHGGHWSRAEAVRRLIQKGLAAFKADEEGKASG